MRGNATMEKGKQYFENSELIGWTDLKQRWQIRDYEILQYLQKGLQTYSSFGTPLDCPPRYDSYFRLQAKLDDVYRSIWSLDQSQTLDKDKHVQDLIRLFEEDGPLADDTREWLELRKEEIAANLKTMRQGNPRKESWKYFEPPISDGETKKLLVYLANNAFFKKKDIEVFELQNNLVRYDLSESERRRCIVRLWAKIWLEEDPEITKSKVISRLEEMGITKIGTTPNGKPIFITPKHVRSYLRNDRKGEEELPFNTAPGVRKSKK